MGDISSSTNLGASIPVSVVTEEDIYVFTMIMC